MAFFNMIPPNEWINTEQQLVEAATYCYNSNLAGNILGFDTETTGLSIVKDLPLILSLSDGYRRFAFEFENFGRHGWIKDGLLGNPQIRKVATFAKFDMHMCANAGVPVNGIVEDTVVIDWLFDENRWSHGLKETARDHLNLKMREFKDVFPMRRGTAKLAAETPGDAIRRVMSDPVLRPQAEEYSGLDPYASVLIRNHLKARLQEVKISEWSNLWDHFENWEIPFTRVLWNCERRGFMIGTGHLRAQMIPMKQEMDEIEGDIAGMAGWAVNVNSPKQLQKLLFEQVGHEPRKMTDGGKSGVKLPSTDEEVLNELAENGCKYAKKIVSFRKIAKMYGTYIVGMLQWVDDENRIHTTLKQTGTVSGRISSTDPNLQNLPRSSGDVYKIREAFTAPIGKRLVVLDYDQLEMKLMAHFSQDERMIAAIREGKDLHCFTVFLINGVPYEDVFAAKKAKMPTPEQLILLDFRQGAKSTGFGLIYGIGKHKLARGLTEELKREVTPVEAQGNINDYFKVFSGVKSFILGTHAACRINERVQTLLGRFRRLPGINAKGGKDDADDGKGTSAEARRQSVNSIIQGTASDIAKAAMIRCENDLELQELGAAMLLQVHDELIFECDDDDETANAVQARAKKLMEDPFNGYQLLVPLTVGGGQGYSWAESK